MADKTPLAPALANKFVGIEVVRATIDAFPAARQWRGLHGIPLLTHAEAGLLPSPSWITCAPDPVPDRSDDD